MVAPKHPKDFSDSEVGMWLVAIGLGDKVELFETAGVDGSMLVILSPDDFGELGLTGLQGKKLMKCLETSKAMAEGGSGSSGPDQATLLRIQELEDENMALRQQLAAFQQAQAAAAAPAPPVYHAPAPAPPPPAHHAPAPAPPPRQPAVTGHVVAGAAGGAARGAIKGAVVGAVLGDAGKGAAAGAAGGAVGGAMGGLGARRRARMRARR